MKSQHTFHIPVMGTGFSIDTPIKVARYGISSVISIVDDVLIEQVRRFYCTKAGEEYIPITKEDDDFRARRITEYLNLVDRIVKAQFEDLKASAFEVGSEITKYFELLPETAPLKKLYHTMLKTSDANEKAKMQETLRESIVPGRINVNIMTKVDRMNYDKDGNELPSEYSDALSALRGYAKSTLASAIVFSAGINRRLYTYAEQFKDFYADAKGFIKKQVVLKVSDYRSAIIQGKFFAKKGIWVSEYRIESGLNCGGHVFPAAGELMGPIMQEFKDKRQEFITALHDICNEALKLREKLTFAKPLEVRVTAQGGIGTVKEDQFVLNYYGIYSTGWGSPFLLVPEVTNVDEATLQKLSKATEKDVYTSDVSPLGVPFNNLRGSESDLEQIRRTEKGRPGSSCPKSYLVSNREFTAKPICTASRQYQKLKLDQISTLNLSTDEIERATAKVVLKACICNDLGEGFVIKNSIAKEGNKLFPAVCPGPNIAYFSKIVSLREMVDHIYGRLNLLNPGYRPHMFIKELQINIEFLQKEIKKALPGPSTLQVQYFNEFKTNLFKGIEYYQDLFPKMISETAEFRQKMTEDLMVLKQDLNDLIGRHCEAFGAVLEGLPVPSTL